jgi:DNA topoisomerase-2
MMTLPLKPATLKIQTPKTPVETETKMKPTVLKIQKETGPAETGQAEAKPTMLKIQKETETKTKPMVLKIQEPKGLDVRKYKKLEHREHVYLRNGMYIGSDQAIELDDWLMDLKTFDRIYQGKRTFPQGAERLFLEVLSNAGDNADRSRKLGVDPGEIEIRMDKKTVCIRNGGLPIPIEIHPEYGIYVAQLIFGTLLTGENFDGDQEQVGQNGIGAKATNVYSHSFMVEVGDAFHGLKYTQIWSQNMKERQEPIIEPYKGKSYVQVVYDMDFERFGYTEYPEEAFAIFARAAADTSFTTRVPVIFNGHRFNITNITDYCNMTFGKEANRIIQYIWPQGVATTVDKKGVTVAVDPTQVPMMEICVVDTPHYGKHVSFVNGLMTRDGGLHVDSTYDTLKGGIFDLLDTMRNDRKKGKTPAKAKAKGKAKAKAGAKDKAKAQDKPAREFRMTINEIKPHISIIVNCHVVNPGYNSQSKTCLTSAGAKVNQYKTVNPLRFTLEKSFFQPMLKWELIDRLNTMIEQKNFKKLTKGEGRKRKNVGIDKLSDANLAGDRQSAECTLFYCEGKSASAYPVKMISLIENGPDRFGIYPGKGKGLNVMNAYLDDILENEELDNLKKALGLHEGVDYTDEQNFKTLRYGRLVILADADDDGKHITGLLLLFFHCRFPSLLARGFVFILRTPTIRLTINGVTEKFYSLDQYKQFIAENPQYARVKPEYFKGLGTSTDAMIADDFKAPRFVSCVYDDLSPAAFELVFSDQMADQRKVWIATWQRQFDIEGMDVVPISSFLREEVVQYSIANLRRAVPKLSDGLKISQRKVLWTVLEKIGYRKNQTKIKVENLAAATIEKTQYHHGGKSLIDAIVIMTQDYTGTNNMPYFTPEGQFGTRFFGGKDASEPRYTYIKLQWWIPFIYRKEDLPLLKKIIDDGEEAEPETFFPIIPMCLVNGVAGIGTGHSTFIPNHNPLDIVSWIRAKIRGTELPDLIPWYRGFNGSIEVCLRLPKAAKAEDQAEKKKEEVIETGNGLRLRIERNDPDEVDDDDDEDNAIPVVNGGACPKYSMVTKGNFFTFGNRTLVDELPIGRCGHDYNIWLEGMIEDRLITDKRHLCKHDTVHFEIQGMKNPSLKNLRLQKSYGMSNMVLLSSQLSPYKYPTVHAIMESFFEERLPQYEARRQYIIQKIAEDINVNQLKVRFVQAVLSKELKLLGQRKVDIAPKMQALGLPMDLLQKVRSGGFTQDEIDACLKEIEKLEERRRNYQRMSASQLWLADLDEFENAYCKHYKCPRPNGRATGPILTVVEEETEEEPLD